MAFSRTAALRSCFRSARPTAARPQLFRQAARRGYASEAHGPVKKGGDAIWAAGAVGVTIPACWFILSNKSDTAHGHDAHSDAHGKSHEEEEPQEEESKEEPEEKTEEKTEEKVEETSDKGSEKSEDSEDEGKDTPDTSDDEAEKGDSDAEKAKGKSEEPKLEEPKAETPSSRDEPSARKDPSSQNTMSGKQEGLSNSDTHHPSDPRNDPDKSTKGEGDAETAKVKGTVDPARPQV